MVNYSETFLTILPYIGFIGLLRKQVVKMLLEKWTLLDFIFYDIFFMLILAAAILLDLNGISIMEYPAILSGKYLHEIILLVTVYFLLLVPLLAGAASILEEVITSLSLFVLVPAGCIINRHRTKRNLPCISLISNENIFSNALPSLFIITLLKVAIFFYRLLKHDHFKNDAK